MLVQGKRNPSTQSFLRINAKGNAAKVLNGGAQALQGIKALQIKLLLVRIYDEDSLIGDILTSLYPEEFKRHHAYSGHYDEKTGAHFQMNGNFVRCS